MQFINLNWIFTLIISLAVFIACTVLYKKLKGSEAVLWILAVVIFVISLIFPGVYFSKTLSQMPVYCSFRAMPYCEILVSFCIPVIAFTYVALNKVIKRGTFKICISWVIFLLCLTFVSIPYIKPIIRPLNPLIFHERYNDGVCMQSTSSTCGPACLVTILRQYGKKDTELSIAKHAFSCGSGTENWYLARYAQQQGLNYKFLFIKNISEVQTPAIIGVGLGRSGHFITILRYDNGLYTIGDPLIGLEKLRENELLQKYHFTGFMLSFSK